MNILYLCDEYPPGRHGGIGTAVQLLARAMVQRGHNVVVAGFYDWGYGGDDHFDDEGVKVYRFRRMLASKFFERQYESFTVKAVHKTLEVLGVLEWDIMRRLPKYRAFLQSLVQHYKIDIVELPDYNDYIRFCHTVVPFPAPADVPMVVKLHGNHTYFSREAGKQEEGFTWKMEHDILHQASAVVSVSRYTAGKTAAYFAYDRNIEVIHNGIDTTKSPEHTERENSVIFTGSLAEKKGIYQLAEAWNKVHRQIPGAVLYVYGKGPVEKIRQELADDAKDSVRFEGHVSREVLLDRLAGAKLAVFPSFAECFSLAPMEAMSCGTAVVYTKRTSGPELITDGEDGLLVDPANVEELAAAIVRLLKDDALRDRIAANGAQTVKTKFDIRVIAAQHEAFYARVINAAAK
jgi:glycosyltransferase involved in cell wall biosynthesis